MSELILVITLIFLVLVLVLGTSVLLAAFITGVPFVPTNKAVLQRMIQIAPLKKGDTCYDLGSGLGHILFEIPSNIKRIGYERIVFLVWGSRVKNIWKRESVEFYQKDFFLADLKKADAIFCYLFPQIMERFYQEIWPTLPKGCRVISNGFPLSPVEATQIIKMNSGTLYLYIKP